MPIYGAPLVYGSPLVYGAESTGLRFVLEVDWPAAGDFSGDTEFLYTKGFSLEHGRKYFINTDGNGFAQTEAGKLDVKLDNRTGRYNTYNTSSPLYPYVKPRRLYRFRAVYDTTVYDLMVGRTTDIKPVGGINSQARLTGADGWHVLQKQITVALQENQTSDFLLDLILDEVQWPVVWGRDIGAGTQTLTYWWADQQTAKSALHSLAHAELGQIWLANNGAFTFRSRHITPDTVTTITGDDLDKEAGYALPQPWEVVRNYVTVSAHPQILQAQSTLWELAEKSLVPAGGTKTLWIDFLYNNESVPAKNVVTSPTPNTDFTANTLQDGSGTNLTGSWTCTVTPFSKRGKVVWKNNSASNGYITLTRVKGQAITSPYQQTLTSEDLASQAVYDLLQFALNEPWLQDTNAAQDFSDFLVSVLANPRPYADFWLLPNLPVQLGLSLNKRYELNIPELGLVGAYNLVWFAHYWDIEDGVHMRSRVLFEPAISAVSESTMVFPYQFEVNSDFGL